MPRSRLFSQRPKHRLLQGKVVSGSVSARITLDGRPYVNFFGSGYLALTSVREVRMAARKALSGGCPFSQPFPAALGVSDPVFEAVEQAGAASLGTGASVYLASGYLIGMVALPAVAGPSDVLFLDQAAHYNLWDAARSSGRRVITFAHTEVDDLKRQLARHVRPGQRPVVVTDGVFATTGVVAPLAAYAELLKPYEGRLIVDESHAFGVVGSNGQGAAEFCGVEGVSTVGATLSKAYCAQGALVGCAGKVADRLRATPAVRGACAGSPVSAAAATAALNYLRRHPLARQRVRTLTEYFRKRLRASGIDVIESPAPIVSFRIGSRASMERLQRKLFSRGIHIYLSTYIGAGRHGTIRCAVFRDHSRGDIDALVDALG